jgi:hypothetical protein
MSIISIERNSIMLSGYNFRLLEDNNNNPGNAHFSIIFNKTLRVPNDDQVHPLPPSNGHFPFFITGNQRIVPIAHEDEALWLEFKNNNTDIPVAVKVLAGGINAITGETESEADYAILRNNDETGKRQNYMMVSKDRFGNHVGQPWLDGFMIPEDSNENKDNIQSTPSKMISVVRQFIAVELGQGRSVEEKLDGTQRGGVQFIVIPMKPEIAAERKSKRIADEAIEAEEAKRRAEEAERKAEDYRQNLKLRQEEITLKVDDLKKRLQICTDPMEKLVLEAKITDIQIDDIYTSGDLSSISRQYCMLSSAQFESSDETYVMRSLEDNAQDYNENSAVIEAAIIKPGKNTESPVKIVKMGLGAGGKIQQEILTNTEFPIDQFDCEKAQYADLDLVTLRSFTELSNSLHPPREPNAKEYTDAGGLWYKYITTADVVKADPNSRLSLLEQAGTLTALPPEEAAAAVPLTQVASIYARDGATVFSSSSVNLANVTPAPVTSDNQNVSENRP